MSEVIVAEQQLELVNIVQIVQGSLSRNFTLLLKRLNHHDTILSQYQLAANQQQTDNVNQLLRLEQQLLEYKAAVTEQLQEAFQKNQTLEEKYTSLKAYLEENTVSIKKVNEDLFTTQLQFEEKLKQRDLEANVVTEHVKLLAMEQNRLNDEISKKENRVEAQRIIKDTEILKDKNSFIQNQLKVAYHKIEKMEILNEKAERMQAKKEVQIFKQIEERVKKEIKSNLTAPIVQPVPVIPVMGGMGVIGSVGGATTVLAAQREGRYSATGSIIDKSNFQMNQNQIAQYDNRRASVTSGIPNVPFNQIAGVKVALGGNIEFYLQKWAEKMKTFETQIKQMSENLKILNKASGKKESRENKENSAEGMKDKINEVKSQIVKLWAKFDTIDDRVSFNERKIQQRMKTISDLTNLIKQNNVSRLEEKVKNLQTEIFTTLKEIKGKLEGKLNQSDHDKYVKSLEEKLTQMNDLIYLKSDKLQVKKALLFLQSKIKEIILVISEDQQNEKDALLTKKQLKCISCDKQIDKFSGIISSPKGNWDSMPFKDHPSQILGRFGMTNFGSLSKKLKKLQGKDLPVLNKRNMNQSFQANS